MEPLGIDENTRNVGGGIIQGTELTLPLFINPMTGELLVEIQPASVDVPFTFKKNLAIDENSRNTAGGVTNDSNETIVPLTTINHIDLPCLRVEI